MKIAIRENDVFPEMLWAEWIKENPMLITEEPYNYQILEISDDVELKILRYEHFDLTEGVYTFNQAKYNVASGKVLNRKYIPSAMDSVTAYVRAMMKTSPLTDDESKLLVCGGCEDWAPGKHEVGDLKNNMGQTWECHQAHDNATYPDITPDNPQTWATFWRPLHGKSKETARPWVKPQYGTTDMYHAGEYMVWSDGRIKKALQDTVHSPDEYPQAWEDVA